MIFLYCYVEYVTIQYGANFICKVAHFRSTSFALTICWAQTSAGSGPEVAHFGPLLGRPYFGPLTVHLRSTSGPRPDSAHFCAIPRGSFDRAS